MVSSRTQTAMRPALNLARGAGAGSNCGLVGSHTMTTRLCTLVLAVALPAGLPALPAAAAADESPVAGYRVEKGSLTSKALGEQRPYFVGLPESYARAADRRYPVIYVLDGAAQGVPTAQTAAKMSREGAMPEVIVVAIPNVSDSSRARDYTPPGLRQDHERADSPPGRANAFVAFLRDELIPKVEHDYRTTANRMLAGNSRGGLLVIYSLIAAPSLFEARFAHSAPVWREDNALVKRLDDFLGQRPALRGALFLSVGSKETERIRAGFQRTVEVLKKRAPATLRWRAEITPDAIHADNARLATPLGFRHVYQTRK
jgi:predicted alpha/beta superfamily hydrolase